MNRMVGKPTRPALPALLVLLVAGPLAAQQPATPQQPAAGQQREHVVRRGDTLWDLARLYLSNPFLWPMIFEANRDVVENPHWIFPAERLIIPPVLQQRAEAPAPETWPAQPAALYPEGVAVAAQEPAAPTTITTVDVRRPVVSTTEYVRLPWLSVAADPGVTGRIQQRIDGLEQSARIAPALYPNEHVRLVLTRGALEGDTLLVVRPGRRVGTQGTIIEPVAMVRVESVDAGGAVGRVVSQFGDARVGDAVMPMRSAPEPTYGEPEAVDGGPEGRILEFLARQSMYGTTDLAFISLGRAQGIGIGDEFAVYVPAGAGAPATHGGMLRVVHVDEGTATVRVISVSGTGLRDGLPIRLARRMP